MGAISFIDVGDFIVAALALLGVLIFTSEDGDPR